MVDQNLHVKLVKRCRMMGYELTCPFRAIDHGNPDSCLVAYGNFVDGQYKDRVMISFTPNTEDVTVFHTCIAFPLDDD